MDTTSIESEMIQATPLAVVQVGADGKVRTWNAAAARMFGVGRDDAIGRAIAAVVPVAGGEPAWTALIAADKPAQREWQTRRDGQPTLTCAWTVHPLSDGGAVCYGQELAAATHEATEQKARDLLLGAMTDTLDIVAWIADKKGVGTLAAGKGLARAGLRPGDLLGHSLVELFGAKYPVLFDILEGKPVHFFSHEGGGHFENWAVPVHDAQGEWVAIAGFALDVTDATVREEELQNKLDLIERQRQAMREMSTPIIEVWDHVICLPLVGLVDTARTVEIMDSLLQAVTRIRARYVILDLTGVDVLDTATANHLLGMTRALRLLGAEGVLTGIHPHVAQIVVTLGVDLSTLIVRATLRDALKFVIGALERR